MQEALGDRARYDGWSILIYLLLVGIGWLNIYSASAEGEFAWNIDQVYVKQLMWIGLAIVLIIMLLALEVRFYERFAGLIYVVALLSLLGLFVFGKEISGARSWYGLGFMSIQPSEFVKAATALALAKYLSELNTDLKNVKDLLVSFLIILLPAIFIVPQPDPGSALVYLAFFFALHREGLTSWVLGIGVIMLLLFLGTLLIGVLPMTVIAAVGIGIVYTLSRKRNKKLRRSSPRLGLFATLLVGAIAFCLSVNYIFYNVFEDRHRNRINIVLGKIEDDKGTGYNINQSEIAIGSGGLLGKGLRAGTQTKGKFVPEQHTDFIFSTVGEEWGFIGSVLVVILYAILCGRLVIMAERQRTTFARVYGYGAAGIFFIHFFVNVGMVLGLLPTVGIPLPFLSYGGSGLWGFTILLFIFIKLDAHRLSYEH